MEGAFLCSLQHQIGVGGINHICIVLRKSKFSLEQVYSHCVCGLMLVYLLFFRDLILMNIKAVSLVQP